MIDSPLHDLVRDYPVIGVFRDKLCSIPIDPEQTKSPQTFIIGQSAVYNLTQRAPRDIDFEVFGTSSKHLIDNVRTLIAENSLLSSEVDEIFENQNPFLPLRIILKSGLQFDFTLPSHLIDRSLAVNEMCPAFDPNLTFTQASFRKDFTLNAVGIDLREGTQIDPQGGIHDWGVRRLKAVGVCPANLLEVYRMIRFAVCCNLDIEQETFGNAIKSLKEYRNELLPAEREFRVKRQVDRIKEAGCQAIFRAQEIAVKLEFIELSEALAV